MTTIYLIRHSKPLKVNNAFNSDNLQIQNEKSSLSIEGEQIAQEKLNKKEFDNLDILFSSNYVRAIQTAKYLSVKNNLEINIISDLGERKFGIDSWEQLPENFERKQFLDENYKIGNGESQKEVSNRMYSTIMKILDEYKNKRIAIVSHATAISYLLKNSNLHTAILGHLSKESNFPELAYQTTVDELISTGCNTDSINLSVANRDFPGKMITL